MTQRPADLWHQPTRGRTWTALSPDAGPPALWTTLRRGSPEVAGQPRDVPSERRYCPLRPSIPARSGSRRQSPLSALCLVESLEILVRRTGQEGTRMPKLGNGGRCPPRPVRRDEQMGGLSPQGPRQSIDVHQWIVATDDRRRTADRPCDLIGDPLKIRRSGPTGGEHLLSVRWSQPGLTVPTCDFGCDAKHHERKDRDEESDDRKAREGEGGPAERLLSSPWPPRAPEFRTPFPCWASQTRRQT